MLAKRIIPCLDVKNGKVVKWVQCKQHQIIGDVLQLAAHYNKAGADELFFYDITASSEQRTVDYQWVTDIAKLINIPFCVAGGIRARKAAEKILLAGADKISLNSPALENPDLIDQLVNEFGQQCIVIGIDSFMSHDQYQVCQYTGDVKTMKKTLRVTSDWIEEVQQRGAGEIVLNCMNHDRMRHGFDLKQLKHMRKLTKVPLIASGGAGRSEDFTDVFRQTNVDGALAASIFHKDIVTIKDLKNSLSRQGIRVRL